MTSSTIFTAHAVDHYMVDVNMTVNVQRAATIIITRRPLLFRTRPGDPPGTCAWFIPHLTRRQCPVLFTFFLFAMAPNRLNFLASGRPLPPDYQQLTPRTPHSRSGHAEEAITEADLDEDAGSHASYRQQQSEPLLASSASSSFPTSGYRSRGDDRDARAKTPMTRWRKHLTGRALLNNTPLVVGTVLAGILLSMIIVSLGKPDALDRAVGYVVSSIPSGKPAPVEDAVAAPPTPTYADTIPPPGHRISYENYTHFPLTGLQYRQECDKLMGGKFMHHRGYWLPPIGGLMDVMHHDDVTDYHLPEGEMTRVCAKTITYQLDGTVGLAADLALMAQAAALAREVR